MEFKGYHRRPISLLRLLLERYLLIFIILVISAVFLVITYSNAVDYIDMRENHMISKAIETQNEELKMGEYDKLNLTILGKKGYIEIINDKLESEYSSNGKKNKWTKRQFNCIPNVSSSIRYWLEEVSDSDGEVAYIFYKEIYDDKNPRLSQVAVLDKNFNILYSDMTIGGEKLNNESLNYIINDLSELVTQKYEFKNADGETKYAILHIETKTEKIERNFFLLGIVFIIAIVLIGGLVWAFWISRSINKPVKLLRDRISKTKGRGYNSTELPEYNGIIELSDVISAFDRMNCRLQISEEEKEELELERRKLIMDVSHDLKTPITVIKGYTQALESHVIDKEEQEKYLNIIDNKVDLLTELIDQLFNYSTMEHPAFELNKETIDLVEFFREYVADRYDDISASGYNLEVDLPEDEIYFKADIDKSQLKRVFENIINNTMKHNPPGTTIYVGMEIIEDVYTGYNRIIIGDNGVGINKELRKNIFKPFTVGEEARTSGKGTGLGLSIVKKIVEKHSGTIKLLDKCKNIEGTIYEIVLPESIKEMKKLKK